MRIQAKRIPAIVDLLQHEISQGNVWIAASQQGIALQATDIRCFKTRSAAESYLKNQPDRHDNQLAPAKPVYDILKTLDSLQANNELILRDTHLQMEQVLVNYERLKTNVMEEKNYEFLKEQLLKTGFGETLNKELANKMAQGEPEFQLKLKSAYGEKNTEATLHFRKSNESDRYFFNSYDMQLKNKEDEVAKQTFYIQRGNTYTAKEAFNLLDGRAVHKTLTNKKDEKYQAWVQIDFDAHTEKGNHKLKQYHQNYGYDLQKNLAQFPIKELAEDQSRERLIKSLEKGNLQQVTLQLPDGDKKVFITPKLEHKALSALDEKGQKVSLTKLAEEQKQTVKQDVAAEAKQTMKEEKPKQRQRHKAA